MTAEQVATGREDFEAFYRARLPEVLALAHALAGPQDAWDVAQQALLAASRHWDRVGDLARPDLWVRDACTSAAVSRRWPRRSRDGRDRAVLDVPESAERYWAEVRRLPAARARTVAVSLLSSGATPPADDVPDPSRAAAAVEALRLAARSPDPALGLVDLARRRRSRRVRTTLVVGVVLTLLTAAVAVLRGPGAPEEDAGPVDPPGSGAVVTNLSGTGTAGRVLVQGGSSTVLLTSLRDGTPLVNPTDLEVSPEGDRVAMVGDDTLQVVGLGDDPTSVSVPCRRCLYVDWTGYWAGTLLVTSFTTGGPSTSVYADDGTERAGLLLPEGIRASGYSPDRRTMVGVQEVGRGDQRRSRLFTLDDSTGERTPLRATETAPGRFIYDATWSPDGVLVGYLEAGEYDGRGIAAQDYRLMVASADGTSVDEVADLGRCYCVRMADPRFAWSPDGSSLVSVRVSTKDSRDSSEVRVYSLDGTVESVLEGGAPVDWGPRAPRSDARS